MSAKTASVTPVLALLLATTWGCSPALVAFSAPCSPAGPVQLLPPEIGESSGIVASRARPGLFWTHNDASGDGPLFLVDLRGVLVEAVRLEGAFVRDWEDLAIGPCGPDGRGSCLYLADTGDNAERRDDSAIYRLPEPTPGATKTGAAERFALRFPNGPRDVEAMFILPDERLFLVTKGRNDPVELYRVPPFPTVAGAQLSAGPLLLERIQTLTEDSPPLPRWITGGSASPDGRLVALRSYETLQLYRPDADGRLAPVPEGLMNLRVVGEVQGEGVAFAPEGDLVLTSEARPLGGRGTIATLRCQGTDPA
ncbi:MAG: hypothetical protein EXR92_01255 [Gemmatimonadetes bacterium]|nr:hypothetical protein [Gemmatimonadota bacterium]